MLERDSDDRFIEVLVSLYDSELRISVALNDERTWEDATMVHMFDMRSDMHWVLAVCDAAWVNVCLLQRLVCQSPVPDLWRSDSAPSRLVGACVSAFFLSFYR